MQYESLLGLFISYKKWSVVNMIPRAIFTTLHFLHNLCMGPISSCVRLERLSRDKPFRLLGPILKLPLKWSALNMIPGTVFITLNFFVTYELAKINWFVCFLHAFPAQCNIILLLIRPIGESQRKWLVVNMVPDSGWKPTHLTSVFSLQTSISRCLMVLN
jgi:hypothetical protein